MRHRHGGLTLLAALLRGLRSRATLTLGAFVLAAVAVASAVVGPAYQASSAQSFLVTRLQHALPVSTGVSITYRPSGDTTSLADELRHAATVGTEHLRGLFGPATVSVESSPDTVRHLFGFPWSGTTVLAAKAGACAHLVITGSCPRQPGDVIMREAAAVSAHVKVGDRLPFTGYPGRLRVVGVYSLPNDPAAFWFDESRLTSSAPQAARGGAILFEPGPIITDSATIGRLASESLTFHIDRSLSVDAQTTADDVRRARQAVVDLPQYLTTLHDGRYKATEDNSLQFVLADIEQNRGTARDTVTPAVVSLVLVALALLARLLGAAADQRRHELALGSLRGLSARQMWAFGLAEPVLLLLLATPAGFALGYATTLWLSRRWLVSGIASVAGHRKRHRRRAGPPGGRGGERPRGVRCTPRAAVGTARGRSAAGAVRTLGGRDQGGSRRRCRRRGRRQPDCFGPVGATVHRPRAAAPACRRNRTARHGGRGAVGAVVGTAYVWAPWCDGLCRITGREPAPRGQPRHPAVDGCSRDRGVRSRRVRRSRCVATEHGGDGGRSGAGVPFGRPTRPDGRADARAGPAGQVVDGGRGDRSGLLRREARARHLSAGPGRSVAQHVDAGSRCGRGRTGAGPARPGCIGAGTLLQPRPRQPGERRHGRVGCLTPGPDRRRRQQDDVLRAVQVRRVHRDDEGLLLSAALSRRRAPDRRSRDVCHDTERFCEPAGVHRGRSSRQPAARRRCLATGDLAAGAQRRFDPGQSGGPSPRCAGRHG